MLTKACNQCNQQFIVEPEDLEFYDKISPVFDGKKYLIPAPTLCPDCRNQRRLAYRNEMNFYKRKCDLTGKEIISVYHPDASVVVFDTREWWKDTWDPLKYGRDFDFSRNFFEQFDELARVTPRPGILNFYSENSDYTNHSGYNKNSYMCVNTGYCEDMLYCTNYVIHCQDCVDCFAIQKCEQCYECIDTKESSFCQHLIDCNNCNECQFCFDCHSCTNCFGCYNLRHKQYYIYNKSYSKEEYHKMISEITPKTHTDYQKTVEAFKISKKENAIHRHLNMVNTENSAGDHQWNNKHVKESFQIFGSQDCKFCYDAGEMNDAYDATEPLKGNLHYESHATNDGYNMLFTSKCYEDDHLIYCQYCWNSKDCFGCFGLKHMQYCIFNKQYSKEEYEKIVARIIEHMMATPLHRDSAGSVEWGEFFPNKYSPFGYNETVAQAYYPLTKDEASKLDIYWRESNQITKYDGQAYIPKENIDDYKNEEEQTKLLNGIIKCEISNKPFKITPQEFAFYLNNHIPIPHKHFEERYKDRFALRNPRKLYTRNCGKCNNKIQTTYAPNRSEKVYCESCYQKSIL